MNWITILFFALGIATVYVMYRSSQTTAIVATEHQTPAPEGGIEAIEYFWRPG